jgi:hypothetical protein
VAKSVPPDEADLSALRKAAAALPAKLPITGKGGLFPGGAKGKQLIDLALAEGFLAAQEERVKSGKSSKKVTYALVTEKGLRRVVDEDTPKAALHTLLLAVQALQQQPNPVNTEAFRAGLARAAEECVAAIKEAFAGLEGKVLKALAPPPTPAVSAGAVLQALQRALERVEAPVLPVFSSTPATASSAQPQSATPPPVLEDATASFVDAWAKGRAVGCPFDGLWDHLKERYPDLTIGAFHDALRSLHDAGRIRLSGWPRMLDDLPQPGLALFVSSKVMYYAQPAHPSG